MKKLNILLLLVFITSNFKASAFYLIPANTIVNDSKNQEDRTIGNFKGVAAGGSLDVKITMGNKESIRLEGDQEAIAELVTEVNEGILTIHPKTKWSDWSRRYKRPNITVYITAKRITAPEPLITPLKDLAVVVAVIVPEPLNVVTKSVVLILFCTSIFPEPLMVRELILFAVI